MKINDDLTKIIGKAQEKKWVALSKDRSRLIGTGENLLELREKLGKNKDAVVYMKVLPSDIEFAFVIIDGENKI